MRLIIYRHQQNKWGWAISIAKYNEELDKLESAFILHSCPTRASQESYIAELVEVTGFAVEDHP